MSLPLARTIVLTDAGTMAYTEELAAYDGTPAGSGAPAPTPISITGTPPATGTVGQPYTFTPTPAGGSGTRVFTRASGTLLPGLSLSSTTGAITGNPTAAGTMTGLSVRVTDDTGSASTVPTDVTVQAAPVTARIDNTPSNSPLLPTQVTGAHELFLAREAAVNDREARIKALEIS